MGPAPEPAPPAPSLVDQFAALDSEMQAMLVHAASIVRDAHPAELGELGQFFGNLSRIPTLSRWPAAREFCGAVSAVVYLAQVERQRHRAAASPRVHVTRGGGRG